jgi:isoleucyl-tRNA synthetase
MDYRRTLNLPRIGFPVETNPAESEEGILSFWNDLNVYHKRQQINKEKPVFFVYEPPRLANASIDDVLSMILKDIMNKYMMLRGFRTPHIPIWNCYSPNIERMAIQLLDGNRDELKRSEIWKQCRNICSDLVDTQKEVYQRLGIFGYWDKAALCSNSNYKTKAIEIFGELFEAGFIYKGVKYTNWCVECKIDLADAEIEYMNLDLLSMYVKFPVIQGLEELGEDVYLVIWTNTPWTLPANRAIAVHPDHDYVAIELENNDILIMAENAVEHVMQKIPKSKLNLQIAGRAGTDVVDSKLSYKLIKKMSGVNLYKIVYAHPFLDRDSEVVLDRHASFSRGTGCVHTIPKHGQSEYAVDQKRNLGIVSTVDQNGQLTEEAGQFCGLGAFESSDLISLELEKRGCLLFSESIEQQYPHCSYCRKPIIMISSDKWLFNLGVDKLRQRVLDTVQELKWIPDAGKSRSSYAIAERADWSVSRKRVWGIPVPVFYCSKCNSQVDASESITASRNVISRKGVGRWLMTKPNNILADDLACSHCGGRDFRWGTEILDMDFISAIGYENILSKCQDSFKPADICLGVSGQNEKWLQLSLIQAMALEDLPPFKTAMISGTALDESGKKLSEMEDGLPYIREFTEEFSSDVIRLWATSMDHNKNPKLSSSHLKSISKMYRRIINVLRFMLGNLYEYDPESDKVDYEYLQEFDRWILHKLAKFVKSVSKVYKDHQYHRFYHLLYSFCSVDMSSQYLNTVRRRLYVFPHWSSSRRAVQTVIYEVLTAVTVLMSPVLPFMAEHIWQRIPGIGEDHPSVFLSDWVKSNGNFLDQELESRWDTLLKIRSEVYKCLEKFRREDEIKEFSQAYITLYTSTDIYDLLDRYIDELEEFFMVAKVRLMEPDASNPEEIWKSKNISKLSIEARRVAGDKCERCWTYSDTVGNNKQYPTICHKCIAMLEGGIYYI